MVESHVLFLCTGNYYRSRFAETYFNHVIVRQGLAWQARSAGLRVDVEQRVNVGPMSPQAISALTQRGIDLEILGVLAMPQICDVSMLNAATRVVCLLESEHRPMMTEQFPAYADAAVYWDILDQRPTAAYDPMAETARRVETLIASL